MPTHEENVGVALAAVERIVRMFWPERILYLIGAGAGIALLIYAAFQALATPGYPLETAGYLFGSGGFFGIAGGRVLAVFNRSFRILEEILVPKAGQDNAN
ncbi:MAG: hypothetical protein ABIP91_07965 [Sphingomicrobium sp.]